MAPQQSPLFTPLATPTPTPGPQSAATTPAPSSVAFAWNTSPQYVSSTPVPYPAASTPAPEYSSGGQVTDDMGPPPKKKRGPKPKPFSERIMPLATPIVPRKLASYPKKKKDEVITWLRTAFVWRGGGNCAAYYDGCGEKVSDSEEDYLWVEESRVGPWANSEMITHEDVTKAAQRWKLKS
ncbi:hypothetical protein F25303_1691 [Fusarium sp. NRRL 25303]|nr:hypothetical protein F25303_1691 [Fusarium sp. NRRL 25303]